MASRLLAWWRGLSRGAKAVLTVMAVLLAAAGSVAGYRGYEYVEHSNQFCMSCHLMTDAYQRFARSAHSKIECHDCHKSSRASQMWQLYATVFQKPTAVRKHADVPNAICQKCHESGDSTRWSQVAATAGHRTHLMSSDSALRDIQCVVCHGGTDLHSFASVDQTCGKSGCHTSSQVQLGKMGDLSIYCATCHNFLAQSTAISMDSLGRALTPQATQCLSCHEMRRLLGDLDIASDPHRGVCGDCHNPHTQRTATAAVKSCTDAACHAQAMLDTVQFHRGVTTRDRCATCHRPHSFRVEGGDCLRCHANIRNERPLGTRISSGRESPGATRSAATVPAHGTEATFTLNDPHGAGPRRPDAPSGTHRELRVSALFGSSPPQQPAAAGPVVLPRFSHGDHKAERCAACHDSRARHGTLKVRSAADCRGCHHLGEARADCASCHSPVRTSPALPVTFTRPGRESVTRNVRFAHSTHTAVRCVQCHADGADRAPTLADCAGCHTPHHESPGSNCLTCHENARALTTHRRADHTNCSASGCHDSRAARLPDTRAACVVCHQVQLNHKPGRQCSACHQVRDG